MCHFENRKVHFKAFPVGSAYEFTIFKVVMIQKNSFHVSVERDEFLKLKTWNCAPNTNYWSPFYTR